MNRIAIILHLLAAVVWVGGMAFAHFALRPALGETLEPPQRLAVLVATLRRFLRSVGIAVLVILATGTYLLASVAGGYPPAVHVMAAIGVVMAGVYAVIHAAVFPGLVAAVERKDWPRAGALAGRIRTLVAANLVLGLLAVALGGWRG